MVRLSPEELDDALLATHVAGEPLPVANGSPVRLVAPRRRGLDWIKWVERIELG
jgi:DMSO/TMAO reductase YedYZ molybdopterin-dependent catalytic subunit